MKYYQCILSVLFFLFASTSCTKDENSAPVIKGYLNGTEVKEIKITTGSTVNFKYEIQATSKLSKVEVFVRKGIGLGTDSQLFLRKEAVAGDLDGTSYTAEGSVVATTDLMISVGAIDQDGNISTLQLNALVDISEFKDLIMMDAKPEGTSKSFCNTQYGLNLFVANTKADPAAVDFGFAYLEATAEAKACIISFNEYPKIGTYVLPLAKNITSFKKAAAYTFLNAADLETAFKNGTDYPALAGYTANLVASNLQVNDVVAFKTQAGRYGLMLIKAIDRKTELTNNEQTITYNMVVQK